MVDDTVVTLGDNTRFEVRDDLVSAELATGNVALGLLEGTFRLVTGPLTGPLTGGPERPLVVTTPLATIGVRDTDFWGRQSAEPLQVALLGGAGVSVENRAGRVEITEIGAVASVTAPDRAPSPPLRLTPEQLEAAAGTVSW